MSKQRAFTTFRMMFPEFAFDSYHYEVTGEGFSMRFRFSLNDKIVFEPTAFIPNRVFLSFDQPKALLDKLVFHIGMIELISYWKACCPPKVLIRCAPEGFDLTPEVVAFWKKLYWNGLGEFFYVNSINTTYDAFLNMEIVGRQGGGACSMQPMQEGYLVPIGGGKDSVVTLEALRQAGCRVRPLIMNPRGATTLCAERGGFAMDEVLEIRRTIHPQLLDLNKKGCLNGHTPFSAMLAFHTLLASLFSGVRNIALSNESSANESTVVGSDVNHQYSKSLEFEDDFRNYVQQQMFPHQEHPNYFSFLRPLSELQIAMLFAKEPKYFDVFKSCNKGSKQDIWCGNCPKCLFAYIILSPFIEPDMMCRIFGKNLLDDEGMGLYFRQLIGEEETKPFECVGTISEVRMALAMTRQRWYQDRDLPLLLKDVDFPSACNMLETLTEHNLSDKEMDILNHRLHV